MSSDVSVVPLLGGTVAWPRFLAVAKELTGHSPARGADASGKNLTEYARFIAALAEYREGCQLEPYQEIRNAGAILRHLHFGFLIVAPRPALFELVQHIDINITVGKDSAIVSANLEIWKIGLVECLKVSSSKTLRQIAFDILQFFNTLGLGELWSEHRKIGMSDGTYLLEHKK